VRLIAVPPEGLPRIWPWVENGLRELLRKNESRGTPEQARQLLEDGSGYLFLIEGVNAFIVFKKLADVDGSVALHIWALWGRGVVKVLDELVAAIDDLGRAIGADSVTMTSRRAWSRFGHWTETSRNYERRI
jgi:hypothetical protein